MRSEFGEQFSSRTHRRVSGDNLFGAGLLCLCDQGFDIQGIENIRGTLKRSVDPFCRVTCSGCDEATCIVTPQGCGIGRYNRRLDCRRRRKERLWVHVIRGYQQQCRLLPVKLRCEGNGTRICDGQIRWDYSRRCQPFRCKSPIGVARDIVRRREICFARGLQAGHPTP